MLLALLGAFLDVPARVGRGAELLDRLRPGWAAEIDVERLDVGDARHCPLGQLYGNYREGRIALGIPGDDESCLYGFMSSVSWPIPILELLCRIEDACLGDAWVLEVRSRAGRDQSRLLPQAPPCRCRLSAAIETPLPALRE